MALPISPEQEPGPLTPAELCEWLDERRDAIAERWLLEIRARSEGMDPELLSLVGEFAYLISSFLAPGMGAFREQVEPLFQAAAELFGSLGAHRGQAAGEAVEEFQVFREVILRFLYGISPEEEGLHAIGLRELLQLNRLVDLGVTYASVGHTDALFFNLFQGTGVSDAPTKELLEEVREQVAGLREELDRLVLHEAREAAGRSA